MLNKKYSLKITTNLRVSLFFIGLTGIGLIACDKKATTFHDERSGASQSQSEAEAKPSDPPVGSNPTVATSGSQNVPGTILNSEGTAVSAQRVEAFSREFDFKGSIFIPYVWVVTSNNKVLRFQIDEAKTYPRTEWKIPPPALGGGNRTYVTEVGLLVGKTASNGKPGQIWLVNDKFGEEAKLIDTVTDSFDETRICVTSFKKEGEAYIGYIYSQMPDKKVKFVRIPIDKSKELMIDIARKESFTSNTVGMVGYSCFIDQKNNRFWAGQGPIIGFDLNTDKFLTHVSLPNDGWKVDGGVAEYTKRVNYAIAGDAEGNLLNANIGGKGTYTMAHERLTNKVFISTRSPAIIVTDVGCFSKEASCANKTYIFEGSTEKDGALSTLSETGGPLSSLNDGRVALLTRSGNPSSLMLISLKNNDKPAEGLTIEKIADLPGDPYMYTDFTGGTMYAPTVEQTFNVTEGNDKFVVGKRTEMKFIWESATTLAEDQNWRGLKVMVRCYKGTTEEKPEYRRVSPIAKAGMETKVTEAKCVSGAFDHFDLKLEAEEGTSVFTKSKKIVIKILQ